MHVKLNNKITGTKSSKLIRTARNINPAKIMTNISKLFMLGQEAKMFVHLKDAHVS